MEKIREKLRTLNVEFHLGNDLMDVSFIRYSTAKHVIMIGRCERKCENRRAGKANGAGLIAGGPRVGEKLVRCVERRIEGTDR